MVEHRKNVARASYVPSSWFIVLTVLLCIGGAGWIGWLLVDHGPSPDTTAGPGTSTSGTTTKPSATPTPTATTPTAQEPAVERTALVSILNNTGVAGAARAFSGKVSEAGWPIGGIGNWTGLIGTNTVYYPPQLEAEGKLLGKDLGIDRVKPSFAPMRSDRLTVILSGTQ